MKKIIDFVPSKYQNEIFDWVQHGVGNAVVKATAGCGKTKVLVTSMQLLPKNEKCLFIAFNKSIVEELSGKLKECINCTIKTVHSLGYSIVSQNLGITPKVDEYKYRNYLKSNINKLSEIDCDSMDVTMQNDYIENITTLINFSRSNLSQSEKEVRKIANKYSIPIYNDECKVVVKCLEWGKKALESIDYGDMVWLPYELSMKPMSHRYDWIFLDECQDFSHAYVDLFMRCFKRGTRFMAVGDKMQNINQFAGSSGEAFDYMCNYPNTKVFSLPISYRCDKRIVRMAQDYNEEIQYREDAGEGVFRDNCPVMEIQDGDMVLCRSKAPLVKLYFKFLEKGVASYIKGRELGEDLINLVNMVDCEHININLNEDGLFIRLYDLMLMERNKLMVNNGLDLWDATFSYKVMSYYDSIIALQVLAKRCKTKTELIDLISIIFADNKEGICLSTIHKAKGLESDNVYILCRSTMPPKNIKKDWEITQENNLIYVAYTRAKHKLCFVSEYEVKPMGALCEDDVIMNDIKYIEKCICKVLGKEVMTPQTAPSLSNFRLKVATKVKGIHDDDNFIVLDKEDNDNKDIEVDFDDLIKELKE